MGKDETPETRTTAIAPMPWGVAMAQIVSVFKMLTCTVLKNWPPMSFLWESIGGRI